MNLHLQIFPCKYQFKIACESVVQATSWTLSRQGISRKGTLCSYSVDSVPLSFAHVPKKSNSGPASSAGLENVTYRTGTISFRSRRSVVLIGAWSQIAKKMGAGGRPNMLYASSNAVLSLNPVLI